MKNKKGESIQIIILTVISVLFIAPIVIVFMNSFRRQIQCRSVMSLFEPFVLKGRIENLFDKTACHSSSSAVGHDDSVVFLCRCGTVG